MKIVQITLDEDLADKVDRAVEKLGTTRPGFTRDALRDALAKIDRQELERRHRRGYEEHPVEPGEFDGWEGRPSVISKEDLPAILAVPFEERLLSLGVHRAAAVSLFKTGSLTLAQGAQLASLALEEFVELLGREGVAAVDYPSEEVAEELSALRTEAYFRERASRGDIDKAKEVLGRAGKGNPPAPGDELPSKGTTGEAPG